MSRKRKFDDILNECIERVLQGEPVEACLAAFPEHAAELEPLLRTAVATRKATDIRPRPEFRQRAAYEFQTAIRYVRTKQPGSLRWQVRWVTAISVVVILLMAGTGTVAAASNSLPDEPLYNVKLFTEDVRIAFTPSALGKAELYAEFTDTRVNEIIQMADKGKVEQVEKATERMNRSLTAIAKLTRPAGEIETAEDVTTQVLSAASAAPTPPTTAPAAAMNVTAPNTAQRQTSPPTPAQSTTPNFTAPHVPPSIQKATPTPAPTPEKFTSANATKLVGTGKIELKTTVSKQAIKNTQDLKEVLKRVPDTVKPSIEKAIDVAGKGYDEALKNMDHKK
jgi:hypothetical protein